MLSKTVVLFVGVAGIGVIFGGRIGDHALGFGLGDRTCDLVHDQLIGVTPWGQYNRFCAGARPTERSPSVSSDVIADRRLARPDPQLKLLVAATRPLTDLSNTATRNSVRVRCRRPQFAGVDVIRLHL